MEPARSWWPSIGCTSLQTIAIAAVATLARVHSARRKIYELGGISALVQLLIKGTAEAQGHAARSLALLAENKNFAYEVIVSRGFLTQIFSLASLYCLQHCPSQWRQTLVGY